MSISIYKIKRWIDMLTGNSIAHVHQGIGKCYSKIDVLGYYNDLTLKVLRGDGELLPVERVEDGRSLLVATEIFQYGLAAYDLFLEEKEQKYFEMFEACVGWACKNQEQSGAWNNFYYVYPDNPYSSMTQGEGVSLLIRAYVVSGNCEYLDRARNALSFMFLDKNNGGTAFYHNDDIILLEYTHLPPVLNGWIFSIFGVLDYVKVTHDIEFEKSMKKSISSMKNMMPLFDNGYWSKYDNYKTIASPFYHDLHIALLEVMADLFDDPFFYKYSSIFEQYKKNKFNVVRAFTVKAFQKLKE
jgi:hypothetical protein